MESLKETSTYTFGPFLLEVTIRRLLRDGQTVPLTAKLFDILLLLVRGHGQILTKETLLSQVWPDSVVEESNLTVAMSALRKALGETAKEHEYIETVPKRGYRFVALVSEIHEENLLPRIVQRTEDHLTIIYINLEKMDLALPWLKKAFADKNHMIAIINMDPLFDVLRDGPRLIDLLRKMALPQI